MKNFIPTLLATSVFALAVTACSMSSDIRMAEQDKTSQLNTASVSGADFERLTGDGWSGFLGYLDYSSGKQASIPVELSFSKPEARTIRYAIRYPGETQYNAKEQIKISTDGRKLDGHIIISKLKDSDGITRIVTKHSSEDNGRAASIKTEYSVSDDSFAITKLVKYEETGTYFQRSQYKFSR